MSDSLTTISKVLGPAILTTSVGFTGACLYSNPGLQLCLLEKFKSYSQPVKRRATYLVGYIGAGYIITNSVSLFYQMINSNNDFTEPTCYYSHMVIFMGSTFFCKKTPMQPSNTLMDIKHGLWLIHSSILGIIIYPILRHPVGTVVKTHLAHITLLCGLNAITVTIPEQKHLRLRKLTTATLVGVLVCTAIVKLTDESNIPALIYQPAKYIDVWGGLFQFCLTYILELQTSFEAAENFESTKTQSFDYITLSMQTIATSALIFMKLGKVLSD